MRVVLPDSTLAVDRLMRPRLGLLTRGVQRVETLAALLPDWQLVHGGRGGKLDAVLAWGRKPSASVAERRAAREGLPLIRVEDGFLRSVGLGHQAPPLSIVVDDLGIYYDVSQASRLERLIARAPTPAQIERAARLRHLWIESRVSKYNASRLDPWTPPSAEAEHVLVVDQTAGDASIAWSGVDASAFPRMLEAALDEHPRARILLKVHPDVIAGRKRGHFERLEAGAASRIDVVADDVHAPALLDACMAIYVVSSQMGFEALMRERSVRCFGLPFYAGWGLTHDALPTPDRRRGGASLDALVHAALVAYPRYLDPESGSLSGPERLIEHIALQRTQARRFPAHVQAMGFSRWKKPIARAFFQGSAVSFVRHERRLDPLGTAVVWGRRPAPEAMETAGHVIRVEDGFIRSVGLGADLVRPLSWVQDDLGIYFDATRPSRLEDLLRHEIFSPSLLQRARRLREKLVASGITKYNVGDSAWTPPSGHPGPIVLVPGQVETDASIAWGHAGLQTNLELLRAVRESRPDAYLVYKPHPDVLAGLRDGARAGTSAFEQARAFCDEIVTDVTMGKLLNQVDELHTLTSLAGFEALLRNKKVVTWGLPFYAGWGLTEDRAPADSPALQRRDRRLSLDELVAATLILYPTYVSRHSGAFTTPEQALNELQDWQAQGPTRDTARWWRRLRRTVLGGWARWCGR